RDQQGRVGVFRRWADGGDWEHVLTEHETHVVCVHPAHPDVVLAGTADGVWRSRDRGATFARTRFPDERKQIWSFLVDAGNADRSYAGGSPIAVYRSAHAGPSWRC